MPQHRPSWMGARLLESPDDGVDQHKLLMRSMPLRPWKIHNPRYVSLSFPKQEWKDAGHRPSEKRNHSAIRFEEALRFLRVASAALRLSTRRYPQYVPHERNAFGDIMLTDAITDPTDETVQLSLWPRERSRCVMASLLS